MYRLLEGRSVVNSLTPSFGHLAELDFTAYFDAISEALKGEEVFRISSTHPDDTSDSSTNDHLHLIVDVDKIVRKIPLLPCPLDSGHSEATDAAIQFSTDFRQQFDKRLPLLSTGLHRRLQQVLTRNQVQLSDFVQPLENLHSSSPPQAVGLHYNFPAAKNLTKQEITGIAGDKQNNHALLRYHAVRLATETAQAYEDLMRQALQAFIDRQELDVAEDLQDLLEDQLQSTRTSRSSQSDLYRLRNLLNQEAIGKLKREAGIGYLEFLYENTSPETQDRELLKKFIQRLRLVEHYLNDPEREDSRYSLNYAGEMFDLRDVLAQSDILQRLLPVTAIIEGSLGESSDDESGENQYAFGIKLKLNGPVAAKGADSVIEYRVEQLDISTHTTKREKQAALGVLFLYSVVFGGIDQPDFNSIQMWEERVLPQFQSSDEQAKQQAFVRMQDWIPSTVGSNIGKLTSLLRGLVACPTPFDGYQYPVRLVVRRSLLKSDPAEMAPSNSFFKPVLNVDSGRQALKYISVHSIDESRDDELISMVVNISIFDTRCFPRSQPETFQMQYDIEGIKNLNILLAPEGHYKKAFSQYRAIVFPYNAEAVKSLLGEDVDQGFHYQFCFLLLAQVALHVIARAVGPKCFLSLFRLALSSENEPRSDDEYFYRIIKVLEQVLGQNNLTSSQGIDITKVNKHKVANSLRSLYAAVPKQFSFSTKNPIQEAIAIVVVSSRKCDSTYTNRDQRRVTLFGEVVGIEPTDNDQVRISLIKKFTANYTSEDLHTSPSVLFDEIHHLYNNLGYRHFIYVAHSPHTSTLHLTRAEGGDDLYFMSHAIIERLKRQNPEAKIYPTFVDQHYTVKLDKNLICNSLYIQDVNELQVTGTQQSLVYFRLFNGIMVQQKQGENDKNFYNGVVTYSTLLNAYPGILSDEEIMDALVRPGPLKDSILNALSLFHYYRYESSYKISFKLNPYKRIIGDESVGARSFLDGIHGKVRFNALAFAAEVRAVLEAVPVQENA